MTDTTENEDFFQKEKRNKFDNIQMKGTRDGR